MQMNVILVLFSLAFVTVIVNNQMPIQVQAQITDPSYLKSLTTKELEQLVGIKESFGALDKDEGPEMCKILLNRTDTSAQTMISCRDVVNATNND
jgi:hypothetical protein